MPDTESDDATLLAAWCNGDDKAGRALYRRYGERIAGFLGTKTRGDIADLVQRTFLKCLEARKRGTEVENVRAYLFRVARNELYDHLQRGHAEQVRFDPNVASLHDLATSPTGRIAKAGDRHLLLLALRRVPIESQLAVELYYWEQLPMAEVATVLGVSRSAAINRVHRARALLRTQIEALGGSEAAARETMSDLQDWAEEIGAIDRPVVSPHPRKENDS